MVAFENLGDAQPRQEIRNYRSRYDRRRLAGNLRQSDRTCQGLQGISGMTATAQPAQEPDMLGA